MTDLANRIAALSPQQQALLKQKLQEKGLQLPAGGAIPRRHEVGPAPLSPAQRRLWFLNQMEPGHAFYNVPMGLRLTGELNVAALEKSIHALVERHETLRTTFLSSDEPRQIIRPPQAISLPLVDLQSIGAGDQEQQLAALADQEIRRPFDLEQGPLFRAALVRLGPHEHALLISIHHLIADGWSRGVLLRDLAAYYRAFVKGQSPSLPALPIQYADFAAWQQSRLAESTELESQLAYWRKQLQDLQTLQLSTGGPGRGGHNYQGAKYLEVLPRSLQLQVKEFSRREGATPFMTLLTVFQALLARYTGQADIVLGAPVANRNWPEVEGLIGFFVNALVLRTDLSGRPSFRAALRRVRSTVADAFAHRDVPFERLVEELKPQRQANRNPLFQVTFQYQDASYQLQNSLEPTLEMPGLRLRRWKIEQGTSIFDLSINLGEIAEGLGVLVEYSTDLFEEAAIARLIGHFRRMLESAMEDPTRPLSELALLSPDEHHAVTVACNPTAQKLPGGCLHNWFEAAAARSPAAVAVLTEERSLTFEQLDRQAAAIARALQARGVGPDTVVGIALERSPELVASVLGVLKAGGAYLPLDPELTDDRLTRILQDCRPGAILADTPLAARFGGFKQAVIQVGAILQQAEAAGPEQAEARRPMSPVATSVSPANLAYVIYTSGSTGDPKGVMVSHAAACNHMAWMQRQQFVEARDTVLLKTPLSFDASVWELFVPLFAGAKLLLAKPGGQKDPEYLGETISAGQVTVLQVVPSQLRMLLEHGGLSHCAALRRLFCGGEVLPSPLAGQVYDVLGVEIYNLYGPTETCIDATFFRYDPTERASTVPIGYPIDNLQAYVLDEHLQAVPYGAAGELYLSGAGLARGYLCDPGLTAGRFLPNLYGTTPGERIYRTGDRVRRRGDDALEFLDRSDRQVKLRGYRIELGEIEAVLRQHPEVQDACVQIHAREDCEKQIIAYAVPADDGPRSESQAAVGGGSCDLERVASWQQFYDEVYQRDEATRDACFNTVGWNSSYTGKPIAQEVMADWLGGTTERILALRPRRVLEIGCGSGMIVFRVAPHTEQYLATDFSAASIRSLRETSLLEQLPQVQLEQRAAHDLSGLVPRSFDLVTLNSVVQYFPSIDYLLEVLDGLVPLVSPGGAVFLGDVRSLPLLEAFHASVVTHQAGGSLSDEELKKRIAARIDAEKELVLDPALFPALARRYPQITHVTVEPKQGRALNELTRFRYDVVLHLSKQAEQVPPPRHFDWERDRLSIGKVRRFLEQDQPTAVVIERVPNQRVAQAVEMVCALDQVDSCRLGATLANSETRENPQPALDPNAFWQLAADSPYQVDVSWAGGDREGRFDVLLRRRVGDGDRLVPLGWQVQEQPGPWVSYANAPLRRQRETHLLESLRSYLTDRLPDYMIPARTILLGALPRKAHGKIDASALPLPEVPAVSEPGAEAGYQSATEAAVGRVWSQALGVSELGRHSHFFDLGGHSLLAAQVIGELKRTLQVSLPIRTIFESPILAAFSQRLDRLIRAEHAGSQPELTARTADGSLPLSFSQQRLWFLDQLLPGSPVYNMPAAVRLGGKIDARLLAQSINRLVARHEILRTTFPKREGQPVQQVAKRLEIALPLVDLREQPPAEREAELARIASAEARRPFDLAAGPLLRAQLLRLADQEHVLLIVMHHIVADGWSVGVMVRELAALYEATSAGRPDPLAALPVQYADYAIWQRRWLQGEVLDRQVAYWKERLRDAPRQMNLPAGRPHPPIPSFRGGKCQVAVDGERLTKIDALTRQAGATRHMVLLAAFYVLLRELCDQDDLLVGTPVANRNPVETEPLVGFFVNTLLLRTDVSGDPTFLEMLARVRETCLSAYAHGDIPFDKIIEYLGFQRDLSRPPLAQVAFALQNTPAPQIDIAGVKLRLTEVDTGTAKTDLTLLLQEPRASLSAAGQDGLCGVLEYNADLFDAAVAQRIARRYEQLLGSLLSAPDTPVEDSVDTSLWNPSRESAVGVVASHRALPAGRRNSNLTDNQLLVWMGQQRSGSAALYNIATAIHIRGSLDVHHFLRAASILVSTCDALRTVVQEVDGIPEQQVLDSINDHTEVVDLGPLDRAALEPWLAERCRRPLPIHERLFDAAIVRVSEHEYCWYLCLHQIIGDGLSLGLLLERLSQLYTASLAGDLPGKYQFPQFSEYVAWERQYRRSNRYERDRAFWESQFACQPSPLTFYGGKNPLRAGRVVRLSHSIGAEKLQQMRALAHQFGFTGGGDHAAMMNLLLTVLATYVGRVTGKREFAIGVPLQNRRRPAFKQTVGLMMQVVPVRVSLNLCETPAELARRLAMALREAMRHGQYAVRNPVEQPAYEVALNYHLQSHSTFHTYPAAPEWISSGYGYESLTLQARNFDRSGGLVLDFDLHCDVFGEETAELGVSHFLTLLDSILHDADQPIAQQQLAPAQEERRLLQFAAGAELEAADTAATVLHRFEAQARRAPAQTAISHEQQSLSYSELSRRVDRLARELVHLGGGPEVLVGLCAERTPAMIVGMLGILQAGGGYVPIDPHLPARRQQLILADTAARVVVTQASLADRLPWPDSVELVLIDQLDESSPSRAQPTNQEAHASAGDARGEPSCSHWPTISPDSVAYVIYTSGSSGRPKGVAVSHRSLSAFTAAATREYGFTAGDRVLQFASMSFDAAVEEVYPTLTSGGTLILRSEEMLRSAGSFVQACRDWEITVLDLPTAYWHQMLPMVAALGLQLPESLRLLILGGERVLPQRVAAWRELMQDEAASAVQLVNSYGPTEATVVATVYPIPAEPWDAGREVPIGHSLAGTQAHVLDEQGEIAPTGVVGELYLGGAGVARGYLRQPGLTAERFVPDPLSKTPGDRLYRSGDLAFRAPDGNLHFVGRADRQVKLHGFRIELEEIERVLGGHEGVQEAAVAFCEDQPGKGQLVAYVLGAGSETVDRGSPPAAVLRAHLLAQLPSYMVPAHFVPLAEMPRTAGGKIDRHRLPPLATGSRPQLETSYVRPRSETEQKISAIWQDALRVERVGVHDNFFELGGHSLLLLDVHAAIQLQFGQELQLVELFQYPTVATLAGRLDGETSPSAPDDQVQARSEAQKQALARQRSLQQARRHTVG